MYRKSAPGTDFLVQTQKQPRDPKNLPYLYSTSTQTPMQRLTYTGTNYDEVKRLCGDKVLAPYFCMGYSMLSVDTGEGFVSVNEGDTIVREDDGSLRIEK